MEQPTNVGSNKNIEITCCLFGKEPSKDIEISGAGETGTVVGNMLVFSDAVEGIMMPNDVVRKEEGTLLKYENGAYKKVNQNRTARKELQGKNKTESESERGE